MRRQATALVLPLLLSAASIGQEGTVRTIAGGGPRDGTPALEAALFDGYWIASSPTGQTHVSLGSMGSRIVRIEGDGTLRTILGTGVTVLSSPDGVRATEAAERPGAMCFDLAGNLCYYSFEVRRIRRIDATTGVITTIAGNGSFSSSGDGGSALAAGFRSVTDLQFDRSGNLYIVDGGAQVVRRIDGASGIITRVIGTGTATGALDGEGGDPSDDLGDAGPAVLASLNVPFGLAIDALDRVYVADRANHRIRRYDPASGIIETVTGTGAPGFAGDGGTALLARLYLPHDVAIDPSGSLFIADSQNSRIRRVDALSGLISTYAGGSLSSARGDGGPATAASIFNPVSLCFDASSNLLAFESGRSLVRRIDGATRIITTVAGNGYRSFSGEGGPATNATFYSPGGPMGVELAPDGRVLIADSFNGVIRAIDPVTQRITTIAGAPQTYASSGPGLGDGGPAQQARLGYPQGMSLHTSGRLYFGEYYRVRCIDLGTGIITSAGGTGIATHSIDGVGGDLRDELGDGGPASSATVKIVSDVAVDPSGVLYLADAGNCRIRRIDPTSGVITTVAGNGTRLGSIDGTGGDPRDDLGDGGPATAATFYNPRGLATDGAKLYIADTGAALRCVDLATGTIVSVPGMGQAWDVELDARGNLILASWGGLTRRSLASGVVRRVAGGGAMIPTSPDGLPALNVGIGIAAALAVDHEGDVLYTDYYTTKVREVDLPRIELFLLSNVAQACDPGAAHATMNLLLELEGAPANGALLRVTDITGTRILYESPVTAGQVGIGPVLFPFGASTVEAEVIENGQRAALLRFVVQVEDRVAPTLVGCGSKALETEGIQTVLTAEKLGLRAIDDCDPHPAITFSPNSRPLGTWGVLAIARDASGNARSCSLTVNIVDTTPPVFTERPDEDIIVELAPGQTSARASWLVQATDNSGLSVSLVFRNSLGQIVLSGSTLFPEGAHEITCTARDTRGNQALCSFRVVIRRVTAPVIVCPSDITVGTDPGANNAAVPFAVTATSQVDPNVALECWANGALVQSGSSFALGQTLVTCYARDIYRNQASCSFRITVEDREPPQLAVPAGLVELVTDCAGREIAIDAGVLGVRASDNADATLEVACSPSSLAPGNHVVGLSVADDAGNRATGYVQVLVLRGPFDCQLLRPLDANVDNKIRLGQTVPIKLAVLCENVFEPAATVRIVSIAQLNGSGTPIENVVIEDSGLSNDAGALLRLDVDKYLYNLSTAHWSAPSGARFRIELSVEKPGHVPTPYVLHLRNR